MSSQQVFFIMAGVCVIVLVIGVLKQRALILFRFLARIVIGSIAMVIFNKFLQSHGVSVAAGLNLVNFLTVGTLGTGGFALIYGILFYSLL